MIRPQIKNIKQIGKQQQKQTKILELLAKIMAFLSVAVFCVKILFF